MIFPDKTGFNVYFSSPWHPNLSQTYTIENFAGKPGIYIYSKPNSQNWNLDIRNNHNSIWYIGMSKGSTTRRIWGNLGNMYELDGSICVPQFKYHRWVDEDNVKDRAIKDAIANGNFVAYCIEISSLGERHFDPEVIEIYLLTCYYRSTGTIPPLNTMLGNVKFEH